MCSHCTVYQLLLWFWLTSTSSYFVSGLHLRYSLQFMNPNRRGKFEWLSLPCQSSYLPAIQSTSIVWVYRNFLGDDFPCSCHYSQIDPTTQFIKPIAKIQKEQKRNSMRGSGPSSKFIVLVQARLVFESHQTSVALRHGLQIPSWSLNIILKVNKAQIHGE